MESGGLTLYYGLTKPLGLVTRCHHQAYWYFKETILKTSFR